MAACFETISRDQCAHLLGRFVGLRVSRPWLGYGCTVFLELGKLRTVTRKTKRGIRRWSEGQVTFMIDPVWRVEKPFSIHFGSGFSDGRIAKALTTLKGQILERVLLTDRLPELQLMFGDGRHLRTLADWNTQPQWTILVHDKSLVELAPVWDGIDVTPCLHVRKGRLAMEYCFDDRGIDIRRLKQYRFYTRRKARS